MRPSIRDLLIVAALAATVFLPRLGAAQLFDEDEPKNAACGREMLERGNGIVPTFNHDLRTDKPILIYWLMLLSYSAFGVGQFAARLPSAVCAIGTVTLTFVLGRDPFGRRAGFFAAALLAGTLMFTVAARASTPDTLLIFCQTLGLTLFVRFVTAARGETFAGTETAAAGLAGWVPAGRPRFLAAYAALGAAVLAKGPVGVLMPCMVIGLLLLVRDFAETAADRPADPEHGPLRGFFRAAAAFASPQRFVRACWAMRLVSGGLLLAAIALPRYVAVGIQADGAWLAGFLGKHNVGRFVGPMEDHGGPIFYHIPAVMIGFFPASTFLPAALVRTWRRRFAADGRGPAWQFLLCWAGVYLVFFSLAGTKLPSYVLPAYVPLALLTAAALHEWAVAGIAARTLFRCGLASFGVVGIGVVAGVWIAMASLLPGHERLAAIGLIPCVGAAVAWLVSRNGVRPAAVVAFAVSAVLFTASLSMLAAPEISREQSSVRLAQAAARRGGPVASYGFSNPNVVCYGVGRVALLHSPEQVAAALRQDGLSLLVPADRLDELRPVLPADVTVLETRRKFFRKGDALLLGRTPAVARTAVERR